MEFKWFTKPQRRINNLSKAELHRHTTNQRNTFHIKITTSAYQITNYATLPIQTEQHTEAQQYS